MTKLDHDRTVFKFIDEAKRQRAHIRRPKVKSVAVKMPSWDGSLPIGRLNNSGIISVAEIHSVACSVLVHIAKHHDVRWVDRLIEAIPNCARADLVKAWFVAFGPVEFVDGRAKYRRSKGFRIHDAMCKPFWRIKKRSRQATPMRVVRAEEET